MVSPNPIIAPDLLEAKRSQALEDGPEILDDVQRPVFIGVGLEAGEQVRPGFNGPGEILQGAHRIKQVLENVHGRHEIEGLAGEALDLEVDILTLQLPRVQTPFAEAEQGRADVRQVDLEPVAGKEDTARADTLTSPAVSPAMADS